MKILMKSLAKRVLIPLKMFGSVTAILIISNEEMNDTMKMVKSLKESGLLSISKTIKNEAKEQKGGFLGILLGFLGASLLENPLRGKGAIRAGQDF